MRRLDWRSWAFIVYSRSARYVGPLSAPAQRRYGCSGLMSCDSNAAFPSAWPWLVGDEFLSSRLFILAEVFDGAEDLSAGELADEFAVNDDRAASVFVIQHGAGDADDVIIRFVDLDIGGHHVFNQCAAGI